MSGSLPSIDTMVNDLQDRGISIHASQLERPTPDLLEGLYMAITAKITGVTMDMIRSLVEDHAEHHSENSAFSFLDRVGFILQIEYILARSRECRYLGHDTGICAKGNGHFSRVCELRRFISHAI